MSDYLKALCSQRRIRLEFTDNDYTILSSRIYNNIPVLRVYNKLLDCPEKIAGAILEYYINNNKKYLKEIENYIEDNLYLLGYEIEPPDNMFIDLIRNSDKLKAYVPTEKIEKKTTDLNEKDILSITQKDFYGSIIKEGTKNTISTFNNFAEIDIIINND